MEQEQNEIQKYGCTKAERDAIQKRYGFGNWEQSPFGVYSQKRRDANRNGVEWNLRFGDWWDVWESSGKWHKRGSKPGQYCMARLMNSGPFEIGNVHIVRIEDQNREIAYMRNSGVAQQDADGAHLLPRDWAWLQDLYDRLP